MALIQTSKLEGPALRWAVAAAKGRDPIWGPDLIEQVPTPQEEAFETVQIMSGELIGVDTWQRCTVSGNIWAASFSYPVPHPTEPKRSPSHHRMRGRTPYEAVMRCFVSSKFGDEVHVPDNLLENSHEALSRNPRIRV